MFIPTFYRYKRTFLIRYYCDSLWHQNDLIRCQTSLVWIFYYQRYVYNVYRNVIGKTVLNRILVFTRTYMCVRDIFTYKMRTPFRRTTIKVKKKMRILCKLLMARPRRSGEIRLRCMSPCIRSMQAIIDYLHRYKPKEFLPTTIIRFRGPLTFVTYIYVLYEYSRVFNGRA